MGLVLGEDYEFTGDVKSTRDERTLLQVRWTYEQWRHSSEHICFWVDADLDLLKLRRKRITEAILRLYRHAGFVYAGTDRHYNVVLCVDGFFRVLAYPNNALVDDDPLSAAIDSRRMTL
ncbi:MAG: hypothetical protein WAS51_14625 [Ilumatobacteraceae bacterium]